MVQEEKNHPASVRVSMRLPFKTYEAMQIAAAHLGFSSIGRTVTWFALLGLQAAQGAASAHRSAEVGEQLLAMFKAAQAENENQLVEDQSEIRSKGKK